jgi:hypothetical protein
MFLTRHKLLYASEHIPRVPLSISGCWINTVLEHQKLRLNDLGVKDVEVTSLPPLFLPLEVGLM